MQNKVLYFLILTFEFSFFIEKVSLNCLSIKGIVHFLMYSINVKIISL